MRELAHYSEESTLEFALVLVKKLVWYLPRPRSDLYQGGFPLHFEIRLLRFLKLTRGSRILQSFGGHGKYGYKVDISRDVDPDIVADAHNLPFRDNVFDMVLIDPPYDEYYSQKLYDCKKPRISVYIREACRVAGNSGFIVHYHWLLLPRPKIDNISFFAVIVILTRVWHRARVISIFRKNGKNRLGEWGSRFA